MTDTEPPARGVVHVASIWRPERGAGDRPGYVLRITGSTPRSDGDAFVLGLARARADAILTSGSILRSEPALRFDDPPHPGAADGLARLRARLGKSGPPVVAVLTRGRRGALDWSHPALDSRAVLVTGPEADPSVLDAARERGLGVERLPRAGAREAVAHLARRCGLPDLDVELGPSASRALYENPARLDELWLATYLEPTLPDGVRGGAFVAPAILRSLFGPPAARVVRRESGGRWSFERFRRGSGPGDPD